MTEYRPRDVFCVIASQYRDCERAEAVTRGIFELGGRQVVMDTPVDWFSTRFPDDDEWRIEFSKFYYGLDLAHAFAVSGDRRYLDRWRDLVLSWIDQVPVDHDPTDVISRRIQNWTYAWSAFVGAENAGPPGASLFGSAADRILESISNQVTYLRANLATERNHRTLELYGLLVAALAHLPLDPDGELASFAAFEMYRNLCSDLLADGVHRELSTHYHAIALRSYLGTRVNADRFGLELGPGYDARLESACNFLANVVRPDGSLPMLSDSDDGDHLVLLHHAADLLDRPELAWVASRGKEGRRPKGRNSSFPHGGYHIQRSGWGDGETPYESERQLIFDCGPVGDSGHGHYDALHIEVSAGGRPLLADPGRYTYSEMGEKNWRHWFKGTPAHNTVSVDGLDQVAYRRGKQKEPTSQVRLREATSCEDLDLLVGEVVSPEYDAIHTRRVLFVEKRWWIVEDELRAHSQHRYDLRFHLTPEASGRTHLVTEQTVRAPGVDLLFASAAPVIEDGWFAPSYGQRLHAPMLSASTVGTEAHFITVIVPTTPAEPPREILSVGPGILELSDGSSKCEVWWSRGRLGWRTWA